MRTRRIALVRWVSACAGLAAIVALCRLAFHANAATAALVMLLAILAVASRWELRYAIVLSIAATACYNFYFLPPVGTFTIADPQNWLALFAFLTASIAGSRLSQRARTEANEARRSQQEIELLLTLCRELLQTDKLTTLVETLPELVRSAAAADGVELYLVHGQQRLVAARHDADTGTPADAAHAQDDAAWRALAEGPAEPSVQPDGSLLIPLRAGVRPRGVLLLRGSRLSLGGGQTAGALVSIALDRAQALEDAAHSEAGKEGERLRTLIVDSITHELRTPLTSIKGSAGALLANPQLAEADRLELAAIIDEEVDRMNQLVSRVVETAQIESRELTMRIVPCTVPDLLSHARARCTWVYAAHPVAAVVPRLPRVLADIEMIGKVLCNLLENAARYSPASAPIQITAERDGACIVIRVADHGDGVEAGECELIFNRLYRGRRHSRVPGTGMGLAISRTIVEAHRGALVLEKTSAQGSVFSFRLPVDEPATSPKSGEATEERL